MHVNLLILIIPANLLSATTNIGVLPSFASLWASFSKPARGIFRCVISFLLPIRIFTLSIDLLS
jgi:hypothetical protein